VAPLLQHTLQIMLLLLLLLLPLLHFA